MPPIDDQVAAFRAQLALAHRLKLPIILHSVQAIGLTLQELNLNGPLPSGGIWHGFNGPADIIGDLLKLNMAMSFGAMVTQSHAVKCRRAATEVPLDSLLVESDCPDHPTPNSQSDIAEPAQLPEVIEALAEIRQESYEELVSATHANAKRLYGLS